MHPQNSGPYYYSYMLVVSEVSVQTGIYRAL